MTVIAMSDKELDRMQVLRDLSTKQITVAEAAGLMRLTRRQVFRLARCYREGGPGRWSQSAGVAPAIAAIQPPCEPRPCH